MQRFKNILCVVSATLKDNVALKHAAELAENNQASLTVVEVIDEIPPNTKLLKRIFSPEDLQAKIVIEHQKILNMLIAPLDRMIKIKSKVLTGISFLVIIHEVLRNRHDLVLKMAEDGGLLNRVFDSNDMHLLRKCPCPVWLVKPKSPKTYQRILAAVDVDDSYPSEELSTRHLLNLQIVEMASSLALSVSAELHIVNAWDAIGEGAMRYGFIHKPEDEINIYIEEIRQQQNHNLNALMDEVTDKLGRDTLEYIKPKMQLLKGHPRKCVPEFARKIEADLVVMGTVARTGVSGFFMGNTAESILNQLGCSVLAAKPPGFVTPVTLDE
jgi:universal stress protein E